MQSANGLPPPKSPSVHRRPRWQTIILRSAILPLLIFAILFVPPIVVGSLEKFPRTYALCSVNDLSPSLITPNVVFGNFTITKARAIDLTWNLAAGRGVQALMGWTTYNVANAALLRLAENVPLSYRTFEAISLGWLSFSSITPLIRAVLHTGGWRAKAIFMVLALSATFILLLPTMADIMTGYVQNEQAYWQFPNGTLEEYALEKRCCTSRLVLCKKTTDCVDDSMPTICVPQLGYTWGFSSPWTGFVSLGLFAWAWSMFGIWVDADRFSVLYRGGRRLGKWRAITDLGGALERDAGTTLSGHSNVELEKEVDAALPVMYTVENKAGGKLEGVVLRPRAGSG
jgi:hypothetical protein